MGRGLHALFLIALLSVFADAARAEIALKVPSEVTAGSTFSLSWVGEGTAKDFVTLVPPDQAAGTYGHYVYAKRNPTDFVAPDDPGTYEVRYLGADRPYPTLGTATIEVTPATATLQGPASVSAGSKISIAWTGPGHGKDFITVVKAGAEERTYDTYVYTKQGSPVDLLVPEEAGSYEARYLTGQKYYTLASHSFEVTGNSATLDAPSSVAAGSPVEIRFRGSGNERDFITIVVAGADARTYREYAYTKKASSVELTAPEQPGKYEIRYLTGQDYTTLATRPLEVTAVSANLTASDEVRGGDTFPVEWSGPGNRQDYITIVESGATEGDYGHYAYVFERNPVSIRAPLEMGEYELRYSTGRSQKTLGRRPIRVTPPKAEPGELRLVRSGSSTVIVLPENAAVEVILDASGSMLQRLGEKRRIDIAKEVLAGLVRESLPPGIPFALRVFGHREAGSCRTDLEVPLSPLASAPLVTKIAKIEAMNLAKTPIARSLELVAEDLGAAKGPSVVVLVTDGEETCEGDPAAAVESLRHLGFDVRVNIVGFAIDDAELKTTFRYWANLGGGEYHDVSDAEDLGRSIRRSLREPYDVLDVNGSAVASGTIGGGSVIVPAGSYSVQTRFGASTRSVTVVAGEETIVNLDDAGK